MLKSYLGGRMAGLEARFGVPTWSLSPDWARDQTGLIIVALSYVLVTCALIWAGHGIPYVGDNNETFSSLNHARNLWTFDFWSSAGLTDEAVSPDPAAHPVLHTHQGNFPRLFAFLLYALGARSAESQILITSLTIGTASVLIGYSFLRRVAGELFATIAMLLLVTDYLMFAQWQVNTYRVWHCFFFFAAFATVHGYSDWQRRIWLPATIALYAGLFYWELVFAFFTSVAAGLYAFWLYRGQLRSFIVVAFAQVVGAVLGLATLGTQLIILLGWSDFTSDVQLTLLARNAAPKGPEFVDRLRQFYDSHNIVFFYNIQSAADYLGVLPFLASFFRYILQMPTPWLTSMTLALALPTLMSDSKLPGYQDTRFLRAPLAIALSPGLLVLVVSLADGGSAVMGAGWRGIGENIFSVFVTSAICLTVAIAAALALVNIATRISLSGSPPRLGRALAASGFLFFMGALLLVQNALYDQTISVRWQHLFAPTFQWLAACSLFCAVLFGALLILVGRRAMFGHWHQVPLQLMPFFISSGLAYLATYGLSSGYLHSGYLARLCPLPIFATQTFVALAWFALVASLLNFMRRGAIGIQRTGLGFVSAAAASLLTLMAVSWICVQLMYFQTSPPDRLASIVGRLETLHADGLVTNNYAVPFALAAGTWGYGFVDRQLTPAETEQIPYLWMADRRTNPRYYRPELYVCFISNYSVFSVTPGDEIQPGCSSNEVVRSVANGSRDGQIIARDEVNDRWAIVRLSWPSDGK